MPKAVKRSVIIKLCLLLFFASAQYTFSQTKDSTATKPSVPKSQHSPKKAAIMSAILPGAGQFYNKKYWKPPVFYAAFATLGYFIVFNNERYNNYKQAYIYSTDTDPNTINPYLGKYSNDNLLTLKNAYQRSRDLAIIGTAAVYVLNVVDAAVDAHMFTFDVSDNLSLNVQPSFQFTSSTTTCPILTFRAVF